MESRHCMSDCSNRNVCSEEWVGLRVWSINRGDQKFWVNGFKLNVHKNCVTAKYVTSQFCDSVIACTNVAELCYVILWVSVQIWQRSLWLKPLVLPSVCSFKLPSLPRWSTFVFSLLTSLFVVACSQDNVFCVSEFDCTGNDSQCYKNFLQKLETTSEVRWFIKAVSEHWTKDISYTVTEKCTFIHVELQEGGGSGICVWSFCYWSWILWRWYWLNM